MFSGPSGILGSDALGHAGTRRTVYYTDDSPPSSTSLPVRNASTVTKKKKTLVFGRIAKRAAPSIHRGIFSQTQADRLLGEHYQEQGDDRHTAQMEPNLKSETQVESRPFLIYNKVSAVINESKNVTGTPMKDAAQDEALTEPPADKEPKTGSPIWYEYGCV